MNRYRFDFTFLFRTDKEFTPETEELIERQKEIISNFIYDRMLLLKTMIDNPEVGFDE